MLLHETAKCNFVAFISLLQLAFYWSRNLHGLYACIHYSEKAAAMVFQDAKLARTKQYFANLD